MQDKEAILQRHTENDAALLREQEERCELLEHENQRLVGTLKRVEQIKGEWEMTMDCLQEMVILVGDNDLILRCNIPFSTFLRLPVEEVVGKNFHELLRARGLTRGEYVAEEKGEEFFVAEPEKYYLQRLYEVTDENGRRGRVFTLQDITKRKVATLQLSKAYADLKASQSQLLQQEKMASIGQLAAGVAHEINNPVGFVTSNLGTLGKYLEKIAGFITASSEKIQAAGNADLLASFQEQRRQLKVDFILADIASLISESLDGVDRVKKIVQNLKNFSRVDQGENIRADINACLDDTLNIAWNELKYKTTVLKEYGELPLTRCNPQQLNQVFMNILVNAAQSIAEKGTITIKTRAEASDIFVSIADSGCGIPAENLSRIFEPFYTTKPIGKGTGLGLSITYDLIKKHGGDIQVTSEMGKGTTFVIRIPVKE